MDQTFGAVLKEWRNQRRISQLDLGLCANVSARHISFLETGRSRPSRDMVMRLCEELDVPRQARNQFMSSAGLAPAYRSRDLSHEDMRPVQQAVEWVLENHAPFPAIAMDRHWNALALNGPAQMLTAGMGVGAGDSLLRVLLENEQVRAAIVNLDDVIRHTISRIRTESAHFGGDPVLDGAITDLQSHLEEGGKGTGDKAIAPAFIPTRYRLNGQEFSFFSTFSQFGTAEDIALSEMKIEMMFPADDQTRDILVAMG